MPSMCRMCNVSLDSSSICEPKLELHPVKNVVKIVLKILGYPVILLRIAIAGIVLRHECGNEGLTGFQGTKAECWE